MKYYTPGFCPEFKRINQGISRKPDDFEGNTSYMICLNSIRLLETKFGDYPLNGLKTPPLTLPVQIPDEEIKLS